ncbi:MAG TPA: 4Fe-4S dicluster domain-containing protein, partial [Phycisphaerae bacterium]|nr:4Fe-4S dicluster domain-containing protein [Phycisphaerae bacterium]
NNVDEMDKTLGLTAVKLSAAARQELRALVKLQMAGTCHLCGACEPACPEHIAVTDMIRYHAYARQYNEKDLARELYAKAGYDPGKLCTRCGRCSEVCPSGVQIARILGELAATVA